jgi:diguanylate cyclase (GGDEF)-like protein/PAS domain S-box-containing protein
MMSGDTRTTSSIINPPSLHCNDGYVTLGPYLLCSRLTSISDREASRAILCKGGVLMITNLQITPEQLLQTIQEGIWVIDQNNITTFVNKTMAEILGYNIKEMLNTNLFNYIIEEEINNTEQKIIARKQGVKEQHESRLKHKDGHTIQVYLKTIPIIDDKGNYQGAVAAITDITDQKIRNSQIEYLMYHNGLTGLYNREYFDQEIERLQICEKSLPIAIIYLDLNDLKLINDTYDHTVGDELLKKTSQIIKSSCRDSDIIVRWGGDEFIVLSPNTILSDAIIVKDRIQYNCQLTKIKGFPISIAAGIAIKTKLDQDIIEVLKEAEAAMYCDKKLNKQIIQDNDRRKNL